MLDAINFSALEISIFYGMGAPGEEELKKHEENGAKRVIFALPPQPSEVTLPILDEYAKHV